MTETPPKAKKKAAKPVERDAAGRKRRKRTWKPGTVTGVKRSLKPWDPERALRDRLYPKTEERFLELRAQRQAHVQKMIAEGKWGRRGIPDGWAGRKEQLFKRRARAQKEAVKIVKLMQETGLVAIDDEYAKEALEFAVGVIRARDAQPVRERLAAARMVLDFTKQKPASKVEATVRKAEDFLAILATGGTPVIEHQED